MKIAVVYNRESQRFINKFGAQNLEKYGAANIKRVTDALKEGGHQVIALEGDKDLIDRLEDFMPAVLKGERPGMVFNLAYGIQGSARYTHVPSMLEMVGIPYVGSGPVAHSLALDKVVAKMIFRQQGVPTPDFVVLESPEFPDPDMQYPLIVKPKNEAVSMGIRVVNNAAEVREAAQVIFDKFRQPVLVEQYIDGREINVGLLGNIDPEALPPVELDFGDGPKVYSVEDKQKKSGREVQQVCPAPLSPELTQKAQEISKRAFAALGCFDCARVDLRMDADENLHVLEINSLPSLGKSGSYVAAAKAAGLEFPALVNRLVQVASSRYFGTPTPPTLSTTKADPQTSIFSFLTQRRDRLEKRVADWVNVSSRTDDALGLEGAAAKLGATLTELGLHPVETLTDGSATWCWESDAKLQGGTLLIAHIDVPLPENASRHPFRREPEFLYGEGIGCSRASLAMIEYAIRALRSAKRLKTRKLGVLVYADEGRDCRYSAKTILAAAQKAKRVLVLRPGNANEKVVNQRRGTRTFRIVAEAKPTRIGRGGSKTDVLLWVAGRLQAMSELTSKKDQLSVSATDLRTQGFALHAPHQVTVTARITYRDPDDANTTTKKLEALLKTDAFKVQLTQVSDRPPMVERDKGKQLLAELKRIGEAFDIPVEAESSVSPSVAGIASQTAQTLCGLGATAADVYTPRESISRLSIMKRTLLLSLLVAGADVT